MTRRRSTVVVSLWLVLSLSLLGADPAVPVLGGLMAVLAAAVFIVVDVGRSVGTVDWARGRRAAERAVETDQRVATLRRRARAALDTDSRMIEASLITLVDDALLDRHRIDRSRDPHAAERVLSRPLRELIAGSRRRVLSPSDLEGLLIDIEAI